MILNMGQLTNPADAMPPQRVTSNTTADHLAVLSDWIDSHPANGARDREAATWGRIAKVSEECGEVIAAFIGVTGQNPRKGKYGSGLDVVEELLDVAVTALAAVEHFNGNDGSSMDLLAAKVQRVIVRAGFSEGDMAAGRNCWS